MTTFQKVIRYLAMALAIFLTVSIIGGILGAVGLFGGLFDDDAVLDDAKTYTVSGNITKLEVIINAADFTIKQAEAFSVESNLKHLTVKEENGVLKIEENKRFGITYNDAMLILCIPTNAVFETVDITTGAGRLTADALFTDSLKLELGAGEVNIASLNAAKDADINGGAGKITISGGSLRNLNVDMGVGQLNLTSAVRGNSVFDLGIGETNVTLIGSKENYKINAEKGIGNITIDGKSVSDFNDIDNGDNNIEVNGGIGTINLEFKEELE